VGVDYVSAIVFALCVFEPMELFVLHRCCGKCCACCFDDGELEPLLLA
jgi:hypothetical protein